MNTLSDVFHHTLKDIYYAEKALLKALPKVAEAASPKLKKHVMEHIEETNGHVVLLKEVFRSIDAKPAGEKCDAIDGLVKETSGIIAEAKTDIARDIALIAACQAIEHYEIARYGALREWAKQLSNPEAHEILSRILDQEKACNNKLTGLAVTAINTRAA